MGKKSAAKKQRREARARGELPKKKAAPMVLDRPIPVTDGSFDRVVVDSDVPVVVDFWAPWCGPCKAIAPALEDLAKEYAGRLKVVKYNTQENQGVAQEMNVRSIPTLAIFKDGDVADVRIGAMPRDRLTQWVEKAITPKRSLWSRITGRDEDEAEATA